MTADTKSFLSRTGLCVILAAAMVGTAELTGEKEIIFPEITALTVGALAAPKQSWRVSRGRMILLIAVCSLLGILFVRYSPLPKAANLAAAYGICQLLLLLSRTNFAPMISAAALPILMDTETIVYPISAVAMTTLTALAQLLLERLGKYEHEKFTPLPAPNRFAWISAAVRTAAAAILAVPLLHFGWNFCIAPPLLVAFTEFSNPNSAVRKNPDKTVIIITACALSGAASRLLFTAALRFPLTISAVIAVIAALVIMKLAKRYIPPAGALAVLPMIIREQDLLVYPAQIFAGAAVFTLLALCFREKNTVENK